MLPALRTGLARALAWPACVLVVVAHVAWGHDDFPTAARLYAGLLASVAILSSAYSPLRVVPVLAIALANFYTAAGAPVFSPGTTFVENGFIRLTPAALTDASLGALVLAMTLTCVTIAVDRFSRGLGHRYAVAVEGATTNDLRPRMVWLIAGALFVTDSAVLLGVRAGALQNFLVTIGAPALYLTLLFWNAERTRRLADYGLFWSAVVLRTLLGLLTGMLGIALLAGFIAGALLWTLRGRIPLWLVSTGVIALLVLNPAKMAYRNMAWGRTQSASFSERLELWGKAIEETYGGQQSPDFDRKLEVTARRLNTLGQIGQVFEWVPNRIPHAGGSKWLMAPALMTPRFLWPDKPVQEYFYNRDYTYTFRIQSRRSNRDTSITLPSVADGYWRLGWSGVVIEGVVFGLLLGLAQGFSRTPALSPLLASMTVIQFQLSYHAFGSLNAAIQHFLVATFFALTLRLIAIPATSGQPTPQRA